MILGIGNDLVDIRRIEKSLERFGLRFVERLFTADERAKGESCSPALRPSHYAKRFAAKEACAKALGTGFAEGVSWRDLGVTNQPSGRPAMVVTGAALERLSRLLPAGMVARVDLSMADEYPMAQAMVIISAHPPASPDPRAIG